MKLLLDTHTFIWWSGTSSRLSVRALSLCTDPENTLFLSVVSIWEIQIKQQAGKLQLTTPLAHLIEGHQQSNNLQILPIEMTHVLAVDTLPMYHKDPFDRLLIAQASIEGTVMISQDAAIKLYPVNVEW